MVVSAKPTFRTDAFIDGTFRAATFRVRRSLRAGTVSVNSYSEGDITTPFGGYKESGFGGRDKGLEAFEQYTQTKTIWFSLRG